MQTTLLQKVARSHAAADLLERSPTLLWLSLSIAGERRWPGSAVGDLLRERRVEILRQLTGVKSEAAVRFLDRIVLCEGDYTELRVIDALLPQQHLWRGLSQWPAIPVHVLAVLLRFPGLRRAALLREFAGMQSYRHSDAVARATPTALAWRDTLRMARVLPIGDAEVALRRCRGSAAVQRIHDRWARRLNRGNGLLVDGRLSFPAPPVAGSDAIHPILSEETSGRRAG